MKVLARIISTILHPLLMPSYIFGFIFLFVPELASPIRTDMFSLLFWLVVVITLLLPCACVYVLYKAKVVSAVTIERRSDRYIPQIFTSIIYIGGSLLFFLKLHAVPLMFVTMGSMAACVIGVTIINFFWKISAHGTSAGGACAFLLFVFQSYQSLANFYCLVFFILLSGLLMSARLKLQVHTLAQVCSGFLLGLTLGGLGLSNLF